MPGSELGAGNTETYLTLFFSSKGLQISLEGTQDRVLKPSSCGSIFRVSELTPGGDPVRIGSARVNTPIPTFV